MQTLLEKVNSGLIEPADAADIALSLCYLIDEGSQLCHLDPACILLDEDNHITLQPGTGAVDCYFAAPEVVFEDCAPSQDTMWFSLGSLLFFMLERKDYYHYAGLDPFDLAADRPGTALVDAEHYTGLAHEVICAMTAWDSSVRSSGVVHLIRLAESIPSRAIVQFTCGDQVVATEEITLKESVSDYRSSEQISGTDQVRYRILPGARIPFRPGVHNVKVRVEPSAGTPGPIPLPGPVPVPPNPDPTPRTPGQAGGTWLLMSMPNPEDPSRKLNMRLMPLNRKNQGKAFPVSLLNPTRYEFFSVEIDPATNRYSNVRSLFHLDLPADPVRKRAYLRILYYASPKGFVATICNQQGQPISKDISFQPG